MPQGPSQNPEKLSFKGGWKLPRNSSQMGEILLYGLLKLILASADQRMKRAASPLPASPPRSPPGLAQPLPPAVSPSLPSPRPVPVHAVLDLPPVCLPGCRFTFSQGSLSPSPEARPHPPEGLPVLSPGVPVSLLYPPSQALAGLPRSLGLDKSGCDSWFRSLTLGTFVHLFQPLSYHL